MDDKLVSTQFLLEEYKMLQNRFESVRKEATSRLNLFVTLISATVGIIAIIVATNSFAATGLKIALLAILSFLSIIGCNVHRFTISRDIETDRIEKGLNRIRRYFVNKDHDIVNYLVYDYVDKPTNYVANYKRSALRRTARILQSTTVGLLAGTLTVFLVSQVVIILLLTFIAFSINYLILYQATKRKLQKAYKKSDIFVNFRSKELN